jgi:hypothetical protein
MIGYRETRARELPVKGPLAIFSLDLETDYASGHRRGLRGVASLMAVLAMHRVVPTIFVEGTILVHEPELVRALDQSGADIQLHCRDHQVAGGDTPQMLAESVELFQNLLGRSPIGYRANTFAIRPELLRTQQELGFAFDSSLLPARIGFGANSDPDWRKHGQAFRLERYGLNEYPVATIPGLRAPFIHSYVCLGQMLSLGLFLKLNPLSRFLVYDMHMVDLVRCLDSLEDATVPTSAKKIYARMWSKGRQDTFDILNALIIRLKSKGYSFCTMTQLNNKLSIP